MIKFLFVARRAPGRTRAAALRHLRDVHGRMVVSPPVGAGAMPEYYAQNHVIDGAYPAGGGAHAIERDLVTQLEFESLDAMRAAVETPYYRTMLRPDEPRFVDDASVVRLNVLPRVILAGARTTHKLFVLVSRARDLDDAAWQAVRGRLAVALAGLNGAGSAVENTVLGLAPDPPFVDLVFEVWFETIERLLAAPGDCAALLASDAIDPNRSIVLAAEEYTEERLRALLEARA